MPVTTSGNVMLAPGILELYSFGNIQEVHLKVSKKLSEHVIVFPSTTFSMNSECACS